MAKHTSVTLSDYFEKFIASEIASGRFGNASEVVRAGLRLLEQEEKKFEALRAAVDEGLNSPESEDVGGDEFMAELTSGLERPA